MGYTDESVFDISVGKDYIVFAVLILRSSGIFLLISDDYDSPNAYPIELFSVTDARVPDNWFLSRSPDPDGIGLILGYERIVFDSGHYAALVERDPEALKTFFQEKFFREHPELLDQSPVR